MKRFDFREHAEIQPAMNRYYAVLEKSTRIDDISIYYLIASLQTEGYAERVLSGSGELAGKRAAARRDREQMLKSAGAIGQRIMGEAALVRSGVTVDDLVFVRSAIDAGIRSGDYSIGILPLSNQLPALAENYPIGRGAPHELNMAVLSTPDGPRVAGNDQTDIIPISMAEGQRETSRRLVLYDELSQRAIRGEPALGIVDTAISRLAA